MSSNEKENIKQNLATINNPTSTIINETFNNKKNLTNKNRKKVKTKEIIDNPNDIVNINENQENCDISNNVIVKENEINNINIIETKFFKNMIINYGKEFLCLFALILTTLASFQNVPPRFSRAPDPKPFFPKSSLVHDSPTGSLSEAQLRVSLSELALMYYYAPWCAESQNARTSYDNVATIFYREVHFGAINCWQPGGECRLQYSKVQSWPVLMAYLPNGLAVQYHGSWTTAGLIKFVKSLLSPIKRFTTPDHLLQETVGCDAVILGFVDMNLNKSQYWNFYQTAVKWLERDPYQEIKFGIVTGESSKLFGVNVLPTVRMYLWNETIEYSGNSSWTQYSLNKWVVDHIQHVSLWLAPPGTKSTSLSPYLKQGPVLLLFTPRNLYADSNDGYNMLRQIGLEYYNCKHDAWVSEMAKEYIPYQRNVNHESYNDLVNKCDNLYKTNNLNKIKFNTNCYSKSAKISSVSFVNVLNSSKSSETPQNPLKYDYCDKTDQNIIKNNLVNEYDFADVTCSSKQIKSCNNDHDSNHDVCETKIKKRKSFLENYKKKNNELETSMLNQDNDPRSPKRINEITLKRKCELLYLSEMDGPTQFYTNNNDHNSLDLISGLACEMNRTFSLMAIDSLLYHTFAERLGIDLLAIENKTAAIIIDHEYESTYLLNSIDISLASLSQFLKDYTKRTLSRFLRSDSVQYKHTHFYNLEEKNYLKNHSKKNNLNEKEKNCKKSKTKIMKSKNIFIEEIYSENFEENVIKTNKTVVTLFHSTQCALCGLMSQNLLTISNILKNLLNIKFVRIDGDKNDLSWFYTMNVFPSLVIFPGDNKKSESRIFPSELKVNAKNILGFIIANLNRPSRLHAMILSCKVSKKIHFLDDCLEILRKEISDNISYSLREWRRETHIRRHIVRRLQVLQNLYLKLFQINHSSDVQNLENNAKYLNKIWTNNYNNN